MKKIANFLMCSADTSSIKVKHTGILEIPEDKDFDKMPLSHYLALEKSKGKPAIMKALLNLERWNKKKNPEISSKARKIIDALMKKHEKENDKK